MTENVTKEIMDGRHYHATIENGKLKTVHIFTIGSTSMLPGLISALTELHNKLVKENA